MSKTLVFVGGGAVARCALSIMKHMRDTSWSEVAYIDSRETDLTAEAIYLGDLDGYTELKGAEYLVTVANPVTRKRLVDKLTSIGVTSFATVIAPTACIGDRTVIEGGALIYPGVTIDPDVVIGPHAIINKHVTIGHDSVIDGFVTVAPGVGLGGTLRVAECVEFGIGSCTIQGLYIGRNAVIGAGAAVIRDVEPETVNVGVPARPIARSGAPRRASV